MLRLRLTQINTRLRVCMISAQYCLGKSHYPGVCRQSYYVENLSPSLISLFSCVWDYPLVMLWIHVFPFTETCSMDSAISPRSLEVPLPLPPVIVAIAHAVHCHDPVRQSECDLARYGLRGIHLYLPKETWNTQINRFEVKPFGNFF